MTTSERIKSIIITIVLTVLCFVPLLDFKTYAKSEPLSLYRVYLNGTSIGVIKSKDKLEQLIDKEQKNLKEEYGVSKVYLPKGLYISEYKTYNANIVSEENIYNLIKETESFTIKGYTVTIKKDEDKTITLNLLNKKDFETAVNNVVKSFVTDEELKAYLEGGKIDLTKAGSKIENLYIKESLNDGIRIKEAYIPSNEKIYLNSKDLTRYILFGDNKSSDTYIVKSGDTVATIAENNKLAVEEFLVVNPEIKSENTLLAVGQSVSVSLISPIITIVEEQHNIEEQVVEYDIVNEYDNSMQAGTSRIKQEGQNGKSLVTQKLKYENGQMMEAVITNKEVLTEVVNKIKVIGTKTIGSIDPSKIPDAGDWYWPTLKPYIISSPYGWRGGELHEALDITGTGHGSPIFAANNGIVYKVWTDATGGQQIQIAHSGNIYTWYAHLSKQLVKAGDVVTRGQRIGSMGSTGYSTGTHLHFGTYVGIPYHGGKSFNPWLLYK